MQYAYPDGRVVTYNYGSGGIDDAASRVNKYVDSDMGSTELAQYAYLGLAGVVEVNHPQPDLQYTLIDLSGSVDPDTGDIYSGLDRFGRVKDCRWLLATGPTDVARYKYGYDRASNRLWREDTVAVSQSKDFDELYSYDGLYRLANMQRGRLNGGHTAMSTLSFEQCWTLDETGNWSNFPKVPLALAGHLWQDRGISPPDVSESSMAHHKQLRHDHEPGRRTAMARTPPPPTALTPACSTDPASAPPKPAAPERPRCH